MIHSLMPLAPSVTRAFERARVRAAERRHVFFGGEGLLEVLLEERALTVRELSDYLDALPRACFAPAVVEPRASLGRTALRMARERATNRGAVEVEAEDFFAVLLAPGSPVDEALIGPVLAALTVPADVDAVSVTGISVSGIKGDASALAGSILRPDEPEPGDADLEDRPEATRRLLQTLLLSSIVVVGQPGSGRRSLVRLLAREARTSGLPRPLADARWVHLDPRALVAGTSHRGDFEARLGELDRALAIAQGVTVLFVEEATSLLAVPGVGGADLAGTLLPHLRNGRVRLVTRATEGDVRERLEKHPALLDALHVFYAGEPGLDECERLLARVPGRLSATLDVAWSPGAVAAAVRACAEELPQCPLPGAAVRLLEHAASSRALECARNVAEGAAERPVVNGQDVLRALSDLHGIPHEHLEADTPTRIAGFADAFHGHIFGQDDAYTAFEGCLTTALMKLSDPLRPRGRMFLLGPPGTGKTESARLLARYLMGRDDALVRLDMSEFQGEASISTLIGSDKGLVGSDDGGRLTEPLRANPHRVVLIDEIEKAHPAIYRLFLQVLDNGELQDKRGRRVSFRHAILVFTSNAGCDPELGLGTQDRAEIVSRLGSAFSPEFLNRIETFVSFAPHTPASRERVAAHQLSRFAAQLQAIHGHELSWTPEVQAQAARPPKGEAGARHVLRWIAEQARSAVATWLALHPCPGSRPRRQLRLELGADGRVHVVDAGETVRSEIEGDPSLRETEGAIPPATTTPEAA